MQWSQQFVFRASIGTRRIDRCEIENQDVRIEIMLRLNAYRIFGHFPRIDVGSWIASQKHVLMTRRIRMAVVATLDDANEILIWENGVQRWYVIMCWSIRATCTVILIHTSIKIS